MPRDLKDGFRTTVSGSKEQTDKAKRQEVPDRIKKHAPAPQLRPDGSWAKQADQVDRRVREEKEAQEAKNKWAARTAEKQDERLGAKFKRGTGI